MERNGKLEKINRIKGIFHILMSALGFAMMSFFVRISGDLPTMEKAFFRNFVAVFVALAMIARSGKKFRVQKGCLPDLIMRSLIGTLGIICNFWAIGYLAIADANILNKLSPFAAVIMSIFVLGEKPGVFDILTVVAAFTGAAFIAKPGAGLASLPALVGVAGGVFAGTAYTFVRKLGMKGESKEVIVLFFSVFSSAVCFLFMLPVFKPMSPGQLCCLILAGVSAAFAQFNITAAYSYAPAKEISVFDYSQVIFAAILGFLFFGEIPDLWSFVGYGIIIGSALAVWIRNVRKS
ncbi:MAG: DMT family transporter [Lachnospiraceae bacterium]|nr:DMT family transporter [Lachnospiraceae bacterium]